MPWGAKHSATIVVPFPDSLCHPPLGAASNHMCLELYMLIRLSPSSFVAWFNSCNGLFASGMLSSLMDFPNSIHNPDLTDIAFPCFCATALI